ncbi:MAG: hypothetical protein K2F63_06100, partial [Muribaculaceae bacterium]|nr:hypothetical protein [Muribaculaceae bacterium]
MKKSFLLILAGTLAVSSSLPVQATNESPLTFFGARRYAEEGSPASQASGIYSVEAKAGAQPELKFGSGDVMANGSTAYNDKDLYVNSYLDFSSWGMGLMWWQQKISPDTWTELQIDNLDSGELGIFDIAAATCYDPTTATVYAICLGDDQAQAFDLCILDLETGKMRHLFPLEKKLASLSFNAQGEAYGIGYDGFLYSLDKSTGAVNQIGDTGYRPTVDQCSIIEYKTGDFYWSAYTDEFKGVLKVDLTTGATEVVTQFDYAFQFGGFYINQSAFEPGAPVTASNLSASFEGASLAGEVTFTMPEKAIDGSDLEGELGWEVSIEGAEPVTGTAAPGSEVKANVTAPSAGTTLIVVRCSAEGNYGIATNTSLWTGMDTPKAVTDLSLEMDGDLAQMSWTLPERGIHEGYVDHSQVRYVIIRGPED